MIIHGYLRAFTFLFLLFPCLLFAQHDRQSLQQPDYDDYNLQFWPRRITVVQVYEKGNDVNFQEVYSFDSAGMLVEYRKRGFGGEHVTTYPLALERQTKYSAWQGQRCYYFDYDDDIVEMRHYDMKNRLSSSLHYIYDEGGGLSQTVEYSYSADSGVVTRRTVAVYDKRERLVSTTQYTADDLLLSSERRKYDRRGNLVKRVQTFYNDDEVETVDERRSYIYDRHGNWVRCSYSLNGKTIYAIVRTIEYYGE